MKDIPLRGSWFHIQMLLRWRDSLGNHNHPGLCMTFVISSSSFCQSSEWFFLTFIYLGTVEISFVSCISDREATDYVRFLVRDFLPVKDTECSSRKEVTRKRVKTILNVTEVTRKWKIGTDSQTDFLADSVDGEDELQIIVTCKSFCWYATFLNQSFSSFTVSSRSDGCDRNWSW